MQVVVNFPVINIGCNAIVRKSDVYDGGPTSPTPKSGSVPYIDTL